MNRKVLWSWLVVALFLGLAGRVRAAEEEVQPYVVLVGIDKYADKQIVPRKTAEADAKALRPLHFGRSSGRGLQARAAAARLGG
jgi:hypothetical protein